MANTNSRILVVDDSPRNIKLLKTILESESYEVLPAASGQEALDIFAKNPPDLVLLDVMMPNMNGFQVCKLIKSNVNYRIVPVVMVTALTDVKDRIEAMHAGADDFLSRPVDAAELIVRVRSLLRIRQLYIELDRVTAQRLQFMAGIAHDIRSPLNALLLNMERLSERLGHDAQVKLLWSNILTCAEQIRTLSNDIMHYYQLETNQYQLDYGWCNISDIITAAIAVITPIAEEKRINVCVEPLPNMTIEVDHSSITQVILNLLTNAVKYSSSGGRVNLKIYDLASTSYKLPASHFPPVLVLPDRGVLVEISDTGRGIAPDNYARVFNEFDRIQDSNARDSSEELEGIGLGLPISQRMVRLHGGELWFTSILGQGATFAFFLPLTHS